MTKRVGILTDVGIRVPDHTAAGVKGFQRLEVLLPEIRRERQAVLGSKVRRGDHMREEGLATTKGEKGMGGDRIGRGQGCTGNASDLAAGSRVSPPRSRTSPGTARHTFSG